MWGTSKGRGIIGGLIGLAMSACLLVPAAPAAAKKPKCNGLRATIVGTPKPDRIRATKKRDVIVAGAGADRVTGATEVDAVCTGQGKDRVEATASRHPRGSHRGLARERRNWAPDPVPGEGDWVLGVGDDELELTCPVQHPESYFQSAYPPIHASEGDDTITDDCSLADEIVGGGGDDRIVAGAGYDTIYGGQGDDVIVDRFSTPDDCDQNPPPLQSQPPVDWRCVPITQGLYQDFEDVLLGGDGHDVITGADGNDLISGDLGNDELAGGNGKDFILGDQGTDTCDGGPDEDLNGLPGTDMRYDCETVANMETPPQSLPTDSPNCNREIYPDSGAFAECLARRPRLATFDWSPTSIHTSGLVTIDYDLGIDPASAWGTSLSHYAISYTVDGEEGTASTLAWCDSPPGPDGLIHCTGQIYRDPVQSSATIRVTYVRLADDAGGVSTYSGADLDDGVLFAPRPAPGAKRTVVSP
jgi:hypothetical protein